MNFFLIILLINLGFHIENNLVEYYLYNKPIISIKTIKAESNLIYFLKSI